MGESMRVPKDRGPNDPTHNPAVERIEAALQLAFKGEAGTQRLTRIIKALDKRQASGQEEGNLRDHLNAALAEIDHIRARAQQRGMRLEGWLAAVADDIGAAGPALDIMALETVFSLVGRMRAYPARTLLAQAAMSRNMVHILMD
jgi:hypothetical protein